MNEETPPAAPVSSPESSHKDRRTGLIVFGILQVLLGIACLGMAALIPFGQLISSQASDQPLDLRMVLPGVLIYFVWGAIFIWLGIGSMQCRRWARAITLVYSWIWLVMGVLMVPMMAWLMPKVMASIPTGGEEMPEGMMGVIIVTQIIFMAFIFIVIPGVLVLFYRSGHVKATCEARDPSPRWTDRCPLPVLAVTLLTWWSAPLMLLFSLSGMAVVPLFGTLLAGLPGAVLMALFAGVLFWIGWSFYRLKMAGWWAFLGLMIVFTISNVITWGKVDVMNIYELMNYPEDQVEIIRQQGWMTSEFFLWSSIAWVLPVLVYLVWIKRFFRAASATT